MLQKKRYTPEQALQKIKHYCSYQERSHTEVMEKLYSYGLWKKDAETLLSQLIEEDYLNEERFARLFAGGKFRMKQWGRIRIQHELKQKRISEYCIRQAMKEIEEEPYLAVIRKLAGKKWNLLSAEENALARRKKTADYLLRKGFEWDLVNNAVKSLGKEEKE